MKILNFQKRIDLTLLFPAVFLTLFGLLSIYSSSIPKGDFFNFKKQIIFFAISISLLIFITFFDPVRSKLSRGGRGRAFNGAVSNGVDLRFLKTNSYLVLTLYVFSLLTLFLLLFFGKEIRGVKGWYKLGPFSFDPVPFAAICLIIVLSKYFSTRHIELKRFTPILFSGLYTLIPVLLILFQPDLGSTLILISVWLGILIFSGIKLRHLLILTLIFLLIFAFSWKFWLENYQKQRILSFFNPQIDKQGISWNANQSKIAIGSGGFFGKGIGKGSQTQYGFLPESQTDFVFSAIAEETGFFGVILLLLALFFLFSRIVRIAFLAKDNFTRLFATGFSFLILSQSFINIGMCLGIFPVVGIPLPFVSYGGSQLTAFYFGLGILMSLEKNVWG